MIDLSHHRSTAILAAAMLSAMLGACHKTPMEQTDTSATTTAGALATPNKSSTDSGTSAAAGATGATSGVSANEATASGTGGNSAASTSPDAKGQ